LLPHEFYAMAEGYKYKQYVLSCEKRRATFLMVAPNIKNPNYEKFCRELWPLQFDNYDEREDRRKKPPVIESGLWNALQKQMNVNPESPESSSGSGDYERILEKHKNLTHG